MKKFLILFLAVACFGFKCGSEQTPANPNGTSDWDQTKHDTSTYGVWNLPATRPAEHLTPKGVKVYWNGEVSARQMQSIDDGISLALTRCLRPQKNWNPQDIYKTFTQFIKHSDFRVILVESNYRSVEAPTTGCPLMITGQGGQFTTCGTLSGVTYVNGIPVQRGGGYILVPFQDDDREICWTLATNCMAHEPEHEIFLNNPSLFNAYANDGYNGNHPYCTGMGE